MGLASRPPVAPPLRIGDLIRRNARVAPERPAASLAGRALTHRELDRAANRVGAALRASGIGQGDRVLAWADTSLEQLALFAGTSKLGAVFAPLDARLGPEEALAVARVAAPRLVVADAPRAGSARALAAGLGVPAADLGRADGSGGAGGLLSGERPQDEVEAPGLGEADPHVMFFTSGSTGSPKAVVISHRANYLRSFQGVFRDQPEISVCMFPLFHMAGFTLALSAWQTRGEIALVAGASAEAILDTAARRRANRLYCIPAIWQRILDAGPSRFDLASLRELDTGTSAVPIELVRALKDAFPGSTTRIYYGSTECGSATALPDADVLRKPGSVGWPSPGVDLRISSSGEICVRSAYLMDGYFGDPAATAAALRDGWYHTGDLGELDDEGCLRVVGRIKEVIRTGGESVAPAEVEAALAAHPCVAEVAVVGVPDARWGEIVCAVVVPTRGAAPTLAELQSHCEGRLAGFKKPRRLELAAALPRTPATGQVQRALLAQQLATRPPGVALAPPIAPC
jgi:acyl-CoA synthetase (AMP-forming)/AMP-acid ligase II